MQTHQIFVALLFAAGIAGLLLALSAWRRRLRIMGTTRPIGEAMRHRGITPADAEAAGLDCETAVAARRCASCSAQRECRANLSRVWSTGVPRDCANRMFFDCIAADKARRSEPRRRLPPNTFAPWFLTAGDLRDKESGRRPRAP